MNLEELNAQYLKLKQEKDNREKEANEYESKLSELEAMPESENKKRELNLYNRALTTLRDEVKVLEANIGLLKEQIKENPEMKKYLEEVTQKKFSRQTDPLKKEKKELEDKKTKLEEIKQLATDHKALGNNLRGMLAANKTVKEAKKELELLEIDDNGNITYTDPDKAEELKARISDAEKKLSTNRDGLQSYIENPKNKCNINMQDIDELISNDKCYVIKDNGEINLDETIGKNITQVNRQINGKDKQIKNYEIALNQNRENTPSAQEYDEPQGTAVATEAKPKWYQFGKRFKNWRNKRKQLALEESKEEATTEEPKGSQSGTETEMETGTEIETEIETKTETKEETQENTFRNALKYDVVKEIRAEYEEEVLKKAKQTRKEEEALKEDEEGR